MTKPICVGELTALPGTKVQGYLTVHGTKLQVPVTLVNGVKPGKTVAITCGVHGGEYPGIETGIRLAGELQPSELAGSLIILHPANPLAFHEKTQYVGPLDGKNLNREFPGKACGTYTERLAYTITTEVFAQADFYMDLHGGDLHEELVPFVLYPAGADPEVTRVSREAASCLGVPYVVGSVSTAGTFGSAAARGVPGFLCEIGGCGLWNETEVAAYQAGVRNVLRYLGVLPGEVKPTVDVEYLPRMNVSSAEHAGCWYPLVNPGQPVTSGERIGEIRDYFGQVLSTYNAGVTGRVLYVIRSLAINIGDPLVAIG